MTYSAFLQHVLTYFRNYFKESAKVSIQKIRKNNQTELDGLVILENGSNISPTLYLNYYYRELLDGTALDVILEQLLDTYQKTKPNCAMDVSFFKNYQNISDRIFQKLVNAQKNEELLAQIPHVRFLDLAVVFYCLISATENGSATILIRREHLALWNISQDILIQHAAENTARRLPPQLLDFQSLLREYLPESSEEELAPGLPMYILTNPQKLYGAASILNDSFLKDFSLSLGSDFYILPSSVHEVLLLPADTYPQPCELNEMVKEVNQTHLLREDVLSDHIYCYSLAEQRIRIMA